MTASKRSNTDTKNTQEIDWDDVEDNTPVCLHTEDYFAIALFYLLASTLVLQVLSRYLLNAPLGWTEEVARYQLIIFTFVGASMGFRKHSHIGFIYFQQKLPTQLRKWAELGVKLVSAYFLVFLIVSTIAILPHLTTHKMTSIDLSLTALYGAVGLALCACLLRTLQSLLITYHNSQ
ncbi:TRAP transporter small permease [Alteromonas sp. KUL49]|uniref:TRAP transporter small permease n=1 Tax=Alteromonas sp. KUL49 TaxID=2480798 RepID=UPI00102F11B4|nr:TRAP transporter small permease [Alteromonas sp. KUL49]TAP38624.1 TRAP transporter small permease [Alteromonas sp. KUL49]GEA12564.1 hypothetical protein KUL49_29390 [Alteromonas sp. KUL49]